ncbi:MAG: serine/threonine protein kinase [Pirellulales bacterium]|nr:serine/threonine protein kinase [Pirellulales bacterium]
MTPERLGPYRLGRRLGRGGMGSVYEGVNEETGEKVAVKVLIASFSDEHDFRQRFASEIETLRRLRHPHIVRLFGFGQQDDRLFYAMELVDGVSLEQELQLGRRFHWQEVIRIGHEMCDALRHAHDRGVIHRDIKPANLLLAADDSIKLSDFGIAKMFGDNQLTAVGSVIGTVEYMAPEQADARPVDARSDLYSLGGVLYALLAGRAPLSASSLPEMLRKQRDEPPEPLDQLVASVPRELVQLIHRLLEKKPERRVANARLLARQFETIGAGLARRAMELRRQAASSEPGEEKALDDFKAGAPAAGLADVDPMGLMPTRAIDPEGDSDDAPAANEVLGGPLPETLATDAFQLAPPPLPPDDEDAAPDESSGTTESVNRFTPVAEEELDRAPAVDKRDHPLFSIHTGILIAGLLTVGLTLWYLLQPPSADTLFERITARTSDGKISSIKAAKGDIKQFLDRYSEDPRCGRLLKLQREMVLDELENEFDQRMKGRTGNRRRLSKELLPIEKAYLEARNYLWLDTEQGIAKLRALVDLYGRDADPSGPTGQCLELARRRLAQLESQSQRTTEDYLELIAMKLAAADDIKDTDREAARKMYEAVVELYATKPWAADAVRRAREALRELKEQDQ